MNQLLLEAPAITKQIMRSFYFTKDMDGFLSYMSEDLTWIGTGENEYKFIYAEIEAYFRRGESKIPVCQVHDDTYQIVFSSGDTCVVMGKLRLNTGTETGILLEIHQRVTFVYALEENCLKVKHMHVSNPHADMEGEEYFIPSAVGVKNYEYLERLLAEKIEVIELLNSTMKSGIKGSYEDDLYSLFYVNEGLAKMLGYTYAEFMEMSAGNTAGIIYPLDVAGALAECKNCLAKSNEYATEYRMQKKDGTLLWVMDAGRRITNSDGITVINSIITDITPLKSALAELQIERERYRIILENVTGVIFEYDIEADILTTFEKVEVEDSVKTQRYEFHHYKEFLQRNGDVHPEDVHKLLAVYTGKLSQTIEIRSKESRDGLDIWQWKAVQCSVLYNEDHQPTRTIGMLRDITKEKEKEQKLMDQAQKDSLTGLLNQSAVKGCVRRYLLEKSVEESYALLIIDLDKFKEVNDTYGHLAGNIVLIGVAEKLKSVCRGSDVIGRIGGDEFMVVLKDISAANAMQKADEIIHAVRTIHLAGEVNFKVSCSIGVALSTAEDEPYDQLFADADKALYQAKERGKNCFSFLMR